VPGGQAAASVRELQEALRGIEQGVSVEEALRILDLLQQAEQPPIGSSNAGRPAGPDY
jgi:hypothetical protein